MSRFKSWTVRNVVLPVAIAPTGSRYPKMARAIAQRQHWPLARLEAFQLARLQQLVKLAQRNCAFYRQRWSEENLDHRSLSALRDLARFPITTKEDVENHFPDGMTVVERRSADWQYVGTRGTTRRVVVVHDFAKRDAGRACGQVVMASDSPFEVGDAQVAIPPDACSTHCGIEQPRAERVRDHLLDLATRRKKFNAEFMSDMRGLVMNRWIRRYTSLPPLPPGASEEDLAAYVAALRQLRPKQLSALPEYLRMLAQYVEQSGDRPPAIALLRPMGANMPASWKPSIERALGGTVRENYGSREMGPMAFDCRLRTGLHVLMDQFILEVVNPAGEPVNDGELGQVLITDLQNHAMPIVRYRIGDLARIERQVCGCGRSTDRIHLEGRVEDALVSKSGKVLTAEDVSNYLFNAFGIDQFELTESPNGKLQLRYVRPANLGETDEELADRFSQWSGLEHPMRARATQLIRPESSGKYRHCKSSSYQLWQ